MISTLSLAKAGDKTGKPVFCPRLMTGGFFCLFDSPCYNDLMKKIKEQFVAISMGITSVFGFLVGLLPATIWLFIFLESLLALYCSAFGVRYFEVFIIQFPVTLFVLRGTGGYKK